MSKAFASQADLDEKKVSFTKLSEHAYAYTAEGDPNTGIVIGDDAVHGHRHAGHAGDGADVIRRIREVTDKPIKYVVLSHYHAVRVLGARGLPARAHHRQPGHLRPDRRARRAGQGERDRPLPAPVPERRDGAAGHDLADHHLHRQDDAVAGQARGAAAAARPRPHQGRHGRLAAAGAQLLFSGDLVEFDATPYAGDAYFKDWPQTLDNVAALKPPALVPGRGAALQGAAAGGAPAWTARAPSSAELYASVQAGAPAGKDLNARLQGDLRRSCSRSTATGSSSTTACRST